MYLFVLVSALFILAEAVQVDYGNPEAFEGDIGLDPGTRELVNGKLSQAQEYKGTTGRIWTSGVIPYVYDRNFDNKRRQLMNRAMEEYHRKTCIRFRQATRNDRDYIRMVNQNACWSIIGRSGGEQLLKMGGHCLQLGTALHELMHAVGFFHEQSRYDRDSHVRIFWNNIQSGESYNFNKYRSNYYGQSYDLNSIMHYRNTEFSKRWGLQTIQSIKNPSLKLGNEYFSQRDLNAINAMYRCRGSGGSGINPGISSCNDSNGNCPGWAQSGYCKGNYQDWMKTNCKKSCRIC